MTDFERAEKLQAEASRAKAALLRMFVWQAEINELMPDGLGDEIRAILGNEIVDKSLGLKGGE